MGITAVDEMSSEICRVVESICNFNGPELVVRSRSFKSVFEVISCSLLLSLSPCRTVRG